MVQYLFLILSLFLGLLLLSQKKQFESQLKLEQLKFQQRESEFQDLREQFVILQSEKVKVQQPQLENQDLAQAKVMVKLAEVKEMMKYRELELQQE